VKNRFHPIELPHIEIPTWGSGMTLADELSLAIHYIVNPQKHDVEISA